MLAPVFANDFLSDGRVLQVLLQADARYRMGPNALQHYYLAGSNNTMIPLSNFVHTRWIVASPSLTRYDGYPAVEIVELPAETSALGPLAIARECLATWDPEGVAAPISTGSKIELSLPPASGARACLRHVKSRLCATPCRRATSHTTAPGISVSSTIRDFSSLLQRRRRSTPRTFPSISA